VLFGPKSACRCNYAECCLLRMQVMITDVVACTMHAGHGFGAMCMSRAGTRKSNGIAHFLVSCDIDENAKVRR
jgi:hypothetical protein